MRSIVGKIFLIQGLRGLDHEKRRIRYLIWEVLSIHRFLPMDGNIDLPLCVLRASVVNLILRQANSLQKLQ